MRGLVRPVGRVGYHSLRHAIERVAADNAGLGAPHSRRWLLRFNLLCPRRRPSSAGWRVVDGVTVVGALLAFIVAIGGGFRFWPRRRSALGHLSSPAACLRRRGRDHPPRDRASTVAVVARVGGGAAGVPHRRVAGRVAPVRGHADDGAGGSACGVHRGISGQGLPDRIATDEVTNLPIRWDAGVQPRHCQPRICVGGEQTELLSRTWASGVPGDHRRRCQGVRQLAVRLCGRRAPRLTRGVSVGADLSVSPGRALTLAATRKPRGPFDCWRLPVSLFHGAITPSRWTWSGARRVSNCGTTVPFAPQPGACSSG